MKLKLQNITFLILLLLSSATFSSEYCQNENLLSSDYADEINNLICISVEKTCMESDQIDAVLASEGGSYTENGRRYFSADFSYLDDISGYIVISSDENGNQLSVKDIKCP
jgi:hypothetical protein